MDFEIDLKEFWIEQIAITTGSKMKISIIVQSRGRIEMIRRVEYNKNKQNKIQ